MWETLGSLPVLSSLLFCIYSIEGVHHGEGTSLDNVVLHVFKNIFGYPTNLKTSHISMHNFRIQTPPKSFKFKCRMTNKTTKNNLLPEFLFGHRQIKHDLRYWKTYTVGVLFSPLIPAIKTA